MAPYFSAEYLGGLRHGHEDAHKKFADLRQLYLARSYKSERAREYATHGFCRRLGTLIRAIDLVYKILPPELENIPERDRVIDATIAIQSFVFNVFGCFDNLAWIWVCEKNVKNENGSELPPTWIGLGQGNTTVRNSFSNDFRTYLESRQEWFDHIKSFRDSLAHRIPLYIPPYIIKPESMNEYKQLEKALGEAMRQRNFIECERLQTEQDKLGLFRPWMIHSLYEETPPVIFHSQLLNDFVTVDELGRAMLGELNR